MIQSPSPLPRALQAPFDVIIAGGGAAGCVMANRLSADPARRVLVLEAGPDAARPGAVDEAVQDNFPSAMAHPKFRWWGVTARLNSGAAPRPHATGRNLGGGSNVNGMGADRGLPEDYDRWAEVGAKGWDWDSVLPYFRKLETDADFRGDNESGLHGQTGPMPVRRQARSEWGPYSRAFGAAMAGLGLPYLADYTGEFGPGYASATTNATPSGRVSAAMAYLTPEVRARPNLVLQPDTMILRLLFEGTRAVGVEIRIGDQTHQVFAREVMVACGAIHTPALMLRSGVGPAEELRRHGITPVADLPGVGRNLQNHPYVLYATYLKRNGRQENDNPYMMQNWARFSSKVEGGSSRDLHLMPFNRTAWHDLGRHCGAMAVTLLDPYSRGAVTLRDKNAESPPDIQFNMFDNPLDFERLVEGCKTSLKLFTMPQLRETCAELFVPDPRLLAPYAVKTPKAARRSAWLARFLDLPGVRAVGMRKYRIDLPKLLEDDAALRDFVAKNAIIQLHDCGTCKMGTPDDSGAVVDPDGRVYGVQGLRVVDASIFPILPRGFTHYITLMAAEKLADAYLAA